MAEPIAPDSSSHEWTREEYELRRRIARALDFKGCTSTHILIAIDAAGYQVVPK